MDAKKKTYWTSILLIIITGVVLEIVPVIDGLLPTNTVTELAVQMALILMTLAELYAALKLVKTNPIVRILLLLVPALLNVVCYHLFINTSFLYLAVILLIGFAFIYPSAKKDEADEKPAA